MFIDKLDFGELRSDVTCYSLPYGFLGIFSWVLTTLVIILKHKDINFNIFSLLWDKIYGNGDDKWFEPNPFVTIFLSIITVGPVIYTCVKCHGNWEIALIAFGQLTPWAFSIFSDGIKNLIDNRGDRCRHCCYVFFGSIFFILLSVSGWLGITVLFIRLQIVKNRDIIATLYLSLYIVPVIIIIWLFIACCYKCCKGDKNGYTFIVVLSLYLIACLHVIVVFVFLSLVNGQWSGIIRAGGGMISTIVFLIGRFLTDHFLYRFR